MVKKPVVDIPLSKSKQAYKPCWVNRFNARLDRLPGANSMYFLAMWFVLVAVRSIALLAEGVLPWDTYFLAHTFMAGMFPFFLVAFQLLDRRAETALETLRPALKVSEEEYHALRYRLTTLPATPTLLANLLGIAIIYGLSEILGWPVSFEALTPSPITATIMMVLYIVVFGHFMGFVYHTIHQLRTINLVYTHYTRINLFQMKPLYALSNVAALTAGFIAATSYAWYALNPGMIEDRTSFFIALIISVLVLVTFVWPQLGIHRLQAEEKSRMLDEASLHFQAAIKDLHHRIDEGDLDGISQLNAALASLDLEHRSLKRIPTWPWEPETVRLLITAVALPLGLWVLQFFLQRALGS